MKINLVAVGGTIGSRYIDGELVISDAATRQIADTLGANNVFGEFKIHSVDVEFADFNTLRNMVARASVGADGVVITHGTDTLAFSAAYLSYAFASTKIPIVLCASDQPLTDYDSNGYDVLNAAKSFIGRGGRGVFVMYKNPGEAVRVHHGARLIPAHLYENFYFSLGGGREFGGNAFADAGLMKGLDLDLQGCKVLCITPYVGLDYSAYNVNAYSAVVQVAYHSGKINTVAFDKFAAQYPDKPMFFCTGTKKYDKSKFSSNITLCSDITQTALYIKLLIGIKNNVKDLSAFVMKNACGEIVER